MAKVSAVFKKSSPSNSHLKRRVGLCFKAQVKVSRLLAAVFMLIMRGYLRFVGECVASTMARDMWYVEPSCATSDIPPSAFSERLAHSPSYSAKRFSSSAYIMQRTRRTFGAWELTATVVRPNGCQRHKSQNALYACS